MNDEIQKFFEEIKQRQQKSEKICLSQENLGEEVRVMKSKVTKTKKLDPPGVDSSFFNKKNLIF